MVIKKIILKILLIFYSYFILEAKKNDFTETLIKSYCLGKINNHSFSEIKKLKLK